jgi:hypothetical protein
MSEPDFRSRAKLNAKGNRFEDMTVGRVFEHHWGRTLTAGDNAAFTTRHCRSVRCTSTSAHSRSATHARS